jgi:hypothetical protein
MTWLAENALMIWALGAIALTMSLIVYVQTRSTGSQLAVALVILVTAALLVAERLIETPREAVRRTLDEIAAAVRENDMPGVLRYVAPQAANLRQEVETAMPLATIEAAGIIGTPQIDVDLTANPARAKVDGRGFVQGTINRSGFKGGQMAQVQLTLIRDGQRWLVVDYTSDTDWRAAVGR